jgi:hypothetical protein
MDKEFLKKLVGNNSYPVVVSTIIEKLSQTEASTLSGSEYLRENLKKLNESETPMTELRAFITGAEKVAGDDVSLKELVNFCKKSVDDAGGDLNFLINMCKEEHFSTLTRLNHPSPSSTIKDFKDSFNKPGSEIEEMIKAGVFDSLKSNLLVSVKKALELKEPSKNIKTLNESANIINYSPVALRKEDIMNNKYVLFFESCAVEYDRTSKKYTALKETEVPEQIKNNLKSLNQTAFDVTSNTFSPAGSWDFNITLDAVSGDICINNEQITLDDARQLLLESVQAYESNPTMVDGFDKYQYLQAADNFINVCKNSDDLVTCDELNVLKNMNESSYVILDNRDSKPDMRPTIIGSSDVSAYNQVFDTYSNMSDTIESILKNGKSNYSCGVSKFFDSQIEKEIVMVGERDRKLVSLVESEKELSNAISDLKNLQQISETGSEAKEKIDSRLKRLDETLDETLKERNELTNNFKFWE